MANIKISELEEYTEAKDSDLLVIVDTTNNETKKIQAGNLGTGGGDTLPIGAIIEYDGTTVPTGYEKVSDGNFSNVYSTDEQVIGKWINGKPLYEKTITFTDFERNGSDSYKVHNIPNIDLAFIDFSKSFGIQPSGETVVGNYAYGTVYSFQISGANSTAILYSVGSTIAMSTIVVTLNYTKTTD